MRNAFLLASFFVASLLALGCSERQPDHVIDESLHERLLGTWVVDREASEPELEAFLATLQDVLPDERLAGFREELKETLDVEMVTYARTAYERRLPSGTRSQPYEIVWAQDGALLLRGMSAEWQEYAHMSPQEVAEAFQIDSGPLSYFFWGIEFLDEDRYRPFSLVVNAGVVTDEREYHWKIFSRLAEDPSR